MEPLGWDEIVSQPGMGGYLSFLNGPVPLPHLTPIPGIETSPDSVPSAGAVSDPEPATALVSESTPGPVAIAKVDPESVVGRTPEVGTALRETTPVFEISPAPVVAKTPWVESYAAPAPTRRPRIRRCAAAHDGHSLGEEVLYQALWKAAAFESPAARTITVGWRGMSQLCRMTPKNCKINTQRLIRKLALEVLSPYNTPESIGTTYRVYAADEIFRRRCEQGLEWVIRSRGVEFVNPATGDSITAHLCGYASE